MQEGRRDHVVEATIIGTAIARFGTRGAKRRRRRWRSCRWTRSAARRRGSGSGGIGGETTRYRAWRGGRRGSGAGTGRARTPADAMRRLAELGRAGQARSSPLTCRSTSSCWSARSGSSRSGWCSAARSTTSGSRWPLGQEPGTGRAVPGDVSRPRAGDDPDGGRGRQVGADGVVGVRLDVEMKEFVAESWSSSRSARRSRPSRARRRRGDQLAEQQGRAVHL